MQKGGVLTPLVAIFQRLRRSLRSLRFFVTTQNFQARKVFCSANSKVQHYSYNLNR